MKEVNQKSLQQASQLVELINDFTNLISYYSDNKPGPAYLNLEYLGGLGLKDSVQLDRNLMVYVLELQRERYVAQLSGMGFVAVPDD